MGVFLFYAGASLVLAPFAVVIGAIIGIWESHRAPSDPISRAVQEIGRDQERIRREFDEAIKAEREADEREARRIRREARRVRRAAGRRAREAARNGGVPRGRHFEP